MRVGIREEKGRKCQMIEMQCIVVGCCKSFPRRLLK
jgi:hypothetical protein